MNPFTSVIVPVFNDCARLAMCLQALEVQTYLRELYEVIVVDNASDEDVKSVVERFKQAKYVYEGHPGSYAARNAGIALAKGDVIAFTDADCIPNPDWIKQGVKSLLSVPNCGLVAGRIELFFQNPKRPTPVELFERIELNFFQHEKLQREHYGMTANVFTFKHVFDDVGNFDTALKSGGDCRWGQKVYAAGYAQVYADNARVAHPARYSFAQLHKRITRLVGGDFDQKMSENPSPQEILIDLIETFKPPFRSLYRTWTHESLENVYQKLQVILVMYFARYIVISEKMRLYLGGSSKRG
jgi:glycosyltransferase involved in cell wall biosynthesis